MRDAICHRLLRVLIKHLTNNGGFRRMKKLAKEILICLSGYLIVSGLLVWMLPWWCPALRHLDIVKTSIEFLGVVSTLSAVLWALFGASFLRKVQRSCLTLFTEKSREYCYFAKEESGVLGEERARLGIFAKVSNASSVDAESCQVVTGEVLASSDGVKFSSFQKVCTAGFNWVYEGGREATVQKGVDKHFKFVELLEKTTMEQKDPGGTVEKPGGRTVSIFVCIPNFVNGQEVFEVGSDYKGVMIPVSLVSKTEEVKPYYLKVVWLGTDLKDYMTADKLKVMVLSVDDAEKDIV